MISLTRQSAQQRAFKWNAPLAIALGALVLIAVLFWPTSIEIADLWQDTVRRRYTHGWLVLGITVWLIWRDRAQLSAIELAPPTFGWCVVAIGSVGWLVGFNAGLLALTMLALPLLALATIWAAAGKGLARRVAFAVLYLYFAFPVWELINPLLQSLTALVNVWLTRIAGIPVTMEGNVIQIPAGSFEIAGGCSGLHFFIVALAIAALQGELDRDDWRTRWLLLGIAAVLALVTNWLRVFIIIVAGQLTDMQHFLVKVDHYYFGWFVFVFALGFYLYLSSRVPRRSRKESSSMPPGAAERSWPSRSHDGTFAGCTGVGSGVVACRYWRGSTAHRADTAVTSRLDGAGAQFFRLASGVRQFGRGIPRRLSGRVRRRRGALSRRVSFPAPRQGTSWSWQFRIGRALPVEGDSSPRTGRGRWRDCSHRTTCRRRRSTRPAGLVIVRGRRPSGPHGLSEPAGLRDSFPAAIADSECRGFRCGVPARLRQRSPLT